MAVKQPPATRARWLGPGRRGRPALSAVLLVATGIALYTLWPALVSVFSSWRGLRDLDPVWFLLMVAAETASFACIWALLRLALGVTDWFFPATAQLTANAFSRIVPGGAAAGGTMQYQMLTRTGAEGARVATSLTTVSLVTTGGLVALPLLALPALLTGIPIQGRLAQAVWMGLIFFALLAAAGAVALFFDRPLLLVGRFFQRLRNLVLRRRPTLDNLPKRLLFERDLIRTTLGTRWFRALLLAVGAPVLDYVALLLALVAVGAKIYPSMVLLAYVVGAVAGMIPLTPGGLGFVEAGLAGTLVLAGVSAADSALAILAYRLVSYWLPMPAGGAAYLLYRRRLQRLGREETA